MPVSSQWQCVDVTVEVLNRNLLWIDITHKCILCVMLAMLHSFIWHMKKDLNIFHELPPNDKPVALG